MPRSPTLAVLMIALQVPASSLSRAATLTVTNLGDSGPGTLREAIATASPGDTIDFAVTGTIFLTSGKLLIDRDLIINGPGAPALAIDGGLIDRVLQIASGATVTIRDVTIQKGKSTASPPGMGIQNSGAVTLERVIVQDNGSFPFSSTCGGIGNTGTLTIRSSTIRGNLAEIGGGICSTGPSLLIEQSVISNNLSGHGGGGIEGGPLIMRDSAVLGNRTDAGGGLRNRGTSDIQRSLFAGNDGNSFGGGILNLGDLTLTNCTVSGNRAGNGGGIYNAGSVTANSVTIASNMNVGCGTGGGVYNSFSSGVTFTARNTIFAYNNACTSFPKGDFEGTLTSAGHNLLQNPSGAVIIGDSSGNIYFVDPLLGPLTDNGGPTPTHAAGDPVVDKGDNVGAPATDQRGLARIVDGGGDGTAVADIGAFERQCPDQDGDGFQAPIGTNDPCDTSIDCNDSDGTIFPGAPEQCNGVDDDCDGVDPAPELSPDSDGDSAGDFCDCAPADSGAFALPAAIGGVHLLADMTGIAWDSGAGQAGTGILYDLMRGRVGFLPVGTDPGEQCIVSQGPDTTTTDTTRPPLGDGFYYLVRGRNVCGVGTYGFGSDGGERLTTACP